MNSLERFIQAAESDECEAMNWLQSNGVISDNCVTAKDVCESDCRKAIEALTQGDQKTLIL